MHPKTTSPWCPEVLFGNFSEAELKDFNGGIGDDESTGEYGYYSDSDLEDDEGEMITSPKTVPMLGPSGPSYLLEGGRPRHENQTGLTGKGKIVRISDMAFVT